MGFTKTISRLFGPSSQDASNAASQSSISVSNHNSPEANSTTATTSAFSRPKTPTTQITSPSHLDPLPPTSPSTGLTVASPQSIPEVCVTAPDSAGGPEHDLQNGSSLIHLNRSRSSSIVIRPTPENELRALAKLGIQCTLSMAQVAAELTPIPCICALVGCLRKVYEAAEQAKVNRQVPQLMFKLYLTTGIREQWKLLQGRCVMVTRIAGAQVQNYGGLQYEGLERAAEELKRTIEKVAQRAMYYNALNDALTFLLFEKISNEIQGLFGELDSCLVLFSYAADIAQAQWIGEFQVVQERERHAIQQLQGEMKKINNSLDTLGHNNEELLGRTSLVLEVLQQLLNDKSSILQNREASMSTYDDAERTVRTILSVTKLQLPPELLLGKQCKVEALIPIQTGITCDIYKASFLGGEQVAKKVFRIGMSDRENITRYAERFLRIARLWQDFRSDYTLPFYGIGVELFEMDKHFQLYMVSPLMKNFDVMTYLKQYGRDTLGMKKNMLRIITDAALGLQYLHNRDTPVVHSGMRGENILIKDSGRAVLGGFGLTKALEEAGEEGIPQVVMTGRTESQRWMPPEMFADDPPLRTPCDVWGWAMAALEVVSGMVPYYTHKQPVTIMLKVNQGPPRRKEYIKFEDYAYRPDEMWELFERCWAREPEARPTMDEVVVRLKEIGKLPEHNKQT
ncbi:Serine/threonine-protein kinase [Ceratobasidium theobromae]|uniref:Serine/threonine-protein kinase n=1 Tax=Ceratobasidium theobromae TaxID=1582974 RepID=A0A5N5QFG7_9AGAM|nr:Serine/threonine-protein kinase [Ceratobasidium theobromae]